MVRHAWKFLPAAAGTKSQREEIREGWRGPSRPLERFGFSRHEMEAYRKIGLFYVSKECI